MQKSGAQLSLSLRNGVTLGNSSSGRRNSPKKKLEDLKIAQCDRVKAWWLEPVAEFRRERQEMSPEG